MPSVALSSETGACRLERLSARRERLSTNAGLDLAVYPLRRSIGERRVPQYVRYGESHQTPRSRWGVMYILFHTVMIGILGTTMYGFVDRFEPNRRLPQIFEDIGSGDRRPCAYRAIARVKKPRQSKSGLVLPARQGAVAPDDTIVRRTCPDLQPAPGTHVTGVTTVRFASHRLSMIGHLAPSLGHVDVACAPLIRITRRCRHRSHSWPFVYNVQLDRSCFSLPPLSTQMKISGRTSPG